MVLPWAVPVPVGLDEVVDLVDFVVVVPPPPVFGVDFLAAAWNAVNVLPDAGGLIANTIPF